MPESDDTAVLFDVDGTLVDAVDNQRLIWAQWADRFGLDREQVYALALRTRPAETVARFLPHRDRAAALEEFQRLEDDDVLKGDYRAFAGAERLLRELEIGRWALVTSNLRRRVEGRFRRLQLPIPPVIVDAESTTRGKPDPEPYLAAAAELRVSPARCLVIEDSLSGVTAGLTAGMTVWSVNSRIPPSGAHQHFPELADAAARILRFVA
ncbi:HAD-IA family hydrolase [Microbacterium sp. LMI12-1-1.1]|uniref:HAD family hydrolase n=1 Tax=Microbacterium sp. LMI12-1-1.1 TaxID=3135225 RepID=UPI00341F5227